MTTRPLYIFDLDGTLALIHHRRHYVECQKIDQDWNRFYLACVNDLPNTPVVKTMQSLMRFADVRIFSGRSDIVKKESLEWLVLRANMKPIDAIESLQMRSQGDYTPDDQLKLGWYNSMSQYNKDRLVAVFDDRQKVVDMWRANGVACFQVDKGDF